MSLEILTALFISINLISLLSELPKVIIVYSFVVLGLGFLAKNISFQTIIKIIFLFIAIILIRSSFQKVSSAEGAISFVLILSTLKFWELKSENDHFNMFLILCLSEAGIFLLNPSFVLFALGSCKILFYLYYILKLRGYDLRSIRLKRLLLLIFPSLVFALILFYTFPRFTQGFLNTAGNLPTPQSGISDVIDIKSLGPLNLSSRKVFKVYLENSELKPSINIYWRQSVLWNYYDGAWRSGERNLRLMLNNDENASLKILAQPHPPLRIVLEENPVQEYITLDDYQANILEKNLTSTPVYYLDQTIRSRTHFKPLTQYYLQYGSGPLQKYSDDFLFKKATRIKVKENEKPLIQNKFFADILPSDSPSLKLKKLSLNFARNKFIYSLNPPNYKSTEDFLLNGQSGYCSHFASAFGVLARMVGLPTRLVSGFLGSEYNSFDHSIIVKELDAHVWVEVYLENGKWVRVDPTELVSPSRLQLSAQDFNNQMGSIFIPKLQFITNIGLWVDALNSKFNETIFGYDQDAQANMFNWKFFKNIKMYNLFIGSFLVFIGFYFIIYHLRKRKEPKHIRRYRRFLKTMAKYNLIKDPHETATQFMKRALQQQNVPHDLIKKESESYISEEYFN